MQQQPDIEDGKNVIRNQSAEPNNSKVFARIRMLSVTGLTKFVVPLPIYPSAALWHLRSI